MPLLAVLGNRARKSRRATRNHSKSVRTFRVPGGSEAKVASLLRGAFIWAQAVDGGVKTLARPEIVKRAIRLVRSGAYKNGSCCRNPGRCRHNNPALLPMVAGGVAAGVAGAVANRFLRNPKAIAEGTAPDGTFYRVVRKSQTGEWVIRAWVKGKYNEARTYYTTDKADALGTFKFLMQQKPPLGKVVGHVEIGGPDIIKFDMGGGVTFNRRGRRKASHRRAAPRRRALRNSPEQPVIAVPFRQGRKYSVQQVANWVEAHGTPAMKKRFAQAMAQYKRFHKGTLPRFITYSLYKMGSHQGISDVEFGVSEGREWMAAYQVPRESGKWVDQQSGGRYVHAHGDSEIDVDVKRPVKLSKLPVRFHTPDGKAVGVIPSKNVKIGEWYEG